MMVDMKDRTSNKPSLPPKVEGNPQYILRIQIESLETIHPDIDPYISLAWWGDAQKYILGSPDSQTDRPHRRFGDVKSVVDIVQETSLMTAAKSFL
jgi:hypothetical protein